MLKPILFFFFPPHFPFSVATFSQRMAAIIKTVYEKLFGTPNNQSAKFEPHSSRIGCLVGAAVQPLSTCPLHCQAGMKIQRAFILGMIVTIHLSIFFWKNNSFRLFHFRTQHSLEPKMLQMQKILGPYFYITQNIAIQNISTSNLKIFQLGCYLN